MCRSLSQHQAEEREAHEKAAVWRLDVADLGGEVA